MQQTFHLNAEGGRDFVIVSHHLFLDLVKQHPTDDLKEIERAIKNYIPQVILDARKVNNKYKLFIPRFQVQALQQVQDANFKRIVDAYFNGFLSFFESADFFESKVDPSLQEINDKELEFYRSFIKRMEAGGDYKGVLLTSYEHAAKLADRLVDCGIDRVISFSPKHGFIEAKKVEPQEGDLVYIAGKPLPLQKKIGEGGEASIFEFVNGKVAKIYKTSFDNQTFLPNCFKFQEEMIARREKFNVLLHDERYQINDRYIILPQFELCDASGSLVGIVMDRAEGIVLEDIITKNMFPFEGFTRSDLLKISKKIIAKFKKLHNHGIIMGDVNLKNILVDAKSSDDIKIYIIDLDGCQIQGFPSTFETMEFSDPVWLEQREQHGFIERSPENERYTLMILLFNILFRNVNPYQQPLGGATMQENARNRFYPYKVAKPKDIEFYEQEFAIKVTPLHLKNDERLLAPAKSNYIHSHLPPYMKRLFYATFSRDCNDYRPTLDQMLKALNNYLGYLHHNPQKDQLEYDNFDIPERDRVYFTCSFQTCGKQYFNHVDKVMKDFYRRNRTHLYCAKCQSNYDTTVEKAKAQADVSPRLKKKAEDLEKQWFEACKSQNFEQLLATFFNDPEKNKQFYDEWLKLSKPKVHPAQAQSTSRPTTARPVHTQSTTQKASSTQSTTQKTGSTQSTTQKAGSTQSTTQKAGSTQSTTQKASSTWSTPTATVASPKSIFSGILNTFFGKKR